MVLILCCLLLQATERLELEDEEDEEDEEDDELEDLLMILDLMTLVLLMVFVHHDLKTLDLLVLNQYLYHQEILCPLLT